MNKTTRTQHAQCRLQQRGLPDLVVDQLLTCGEYLRRGNSYTVVFNNKSLKLIKNYGGSDFVSFIEKKYRSAYLILSTDNVVITAGWRQPQHNFRKNGYRRKSPARGSTQHSSIH